jgi:hypothetical protein
MVNRVGCQSGWERDKMGKLAVFPGESGNHVDTYGGVPYRRMPQLARDIAC